MTMVPIARAGDAGIQRRNWNNADRTPARLSSAFTKDNGFLAGRRPQTSQSGIFCCAPGLVGSTGTAGKADLHGARAAPAQRFHRRLRNILHDNISNLGSAERADVVGPPDAMCRTLIQCLPGQPYSQRATLAGIPLVVDSAEIPFQQIFPPDQELTLACIAPHDVIIAPQIEQNSIYAVVAPLAAPVILCELGVSAYVMMFRAVGETRLDKGVDGASPL